MILTANASSPSQLEQKYQIQDLEVLESEKSFREFFAHAKDVLPSKRKKTWKKMVLSMSMDYLNTLKMTNGNLNPKDYKLTLEISKWSTLRSDEFFVKNRDIVFIKHYKYCFRKMDYKDCYNKASDFYKKYKTHPEFGYTFIKEITQGNKRNTAEQDFETNYQLKFWPFIEKLVKSPISEFYCAQSPLKETIEQKVLQQAYKHKSFQVLKHLHPDCWKVIKKGFISTLFRHTDAYSRKKVFSSLKGTVRLGKTDTYLYTTLQLLSGIKLSAQETLLYWQRMKELAHNYKLREILIAKLKTYIPLPGKVFIGATKQQRHIVKALTTYFPEYLDYYSTTCIDHFSGEKETYGGNPATNCHDLFKLSKTQDILPKTKVYQYTKLTTF